MHHHWISNALDASVGWNENRFVFKDVESCLCWYRDYAKCQAMSSRLADQPQRRSIEKKHTQPVTRHDEKLTSDKSQILSWLDVRELQTVIEALDREHSRTSWRQGCIVKLVNEPTCLKHVGYCVKSRAGSKAESWRGSSSCNWVPGQ